MKYEKDKAAQEQEDDEQTRKPGTRPGDVTTQNDPIPEPPPTPPPPGEGVGPGRGSGG